MCSDWLKLYKLEAYSTEEPNQTDFFLLLIFMGKKQSNKNRNVHFTIYVTAQILWANKDATGEVIDGASSEDRAFLTQRVTCPTI